jgi:copper resistance protein C
VGGAPAGVTAAPRSTVVTVRGHGPAWLLLLLLSAGMTALPAAPARAHAVLVQTVPQAQARLDTPPDLVAVEFSGPVLDVGARLRVLVGGTAVLDDKAVVDGATISHPLAGDLPAGTYQLLWRATSVDGHVVSGGYLFTVATGASRPAVAGAAPAAAPTGSTGSTGAGSTGGSGGGRAQWMLAALAAAGAGLAVLGSRRRFRSAARE